MKVSIVDHHWTDIADQSYIGRDAVQQKLEEVVHLSKKISQAKDADSVKSLLVDLGFVETALTRCRQFHCKERDLTPDDLHINYRYATDSMYKIQRDIAEKHPNIDL